MTHAELKEAALEFREGILDGRPSDSMCFAVCAAFQGFLSACAGYEMELVEADFHFTNHVWLKLPDGNILDPTADQFGFEPVYLGPLPEQYKIWQANKATT